MYIMFFSVLRHVRLGSELYMGLCVVTIEVRILFTSLLVIEKA